MSWLLPSSLHYVRHRWLLRRRICSVTFVVYLVCDLALSLFSQHNARRWCLLRRVVHLACVTSPCTSPIFSVEHLDAFGYVFLDFNVA